MRNISKPITDAKALEIFKAFSEEVTESAKKEIQFALQCAVLGDIESMSTVVELVSLGLWAKKHGVPKLEAAKNELGVPQPGYPQPVANAATLIAEALAALPKEPE